MLGIRILPTLGSTWVMVLFSRSLTQQQYGLYQGCWIQLVLLNTLALLGIPALLLTFSTTTVIALARSIKPWQIGVWSLWLLAIGLVFIGLQGSTLMPLGLAFLLFILYSISALLESFLIACRSFLLVFSNSVWYTLFFLAAHGFVLFYGWSMTELFIVLSCCLTFRVAINGYSCLKIIRAKARVDGDHPVGAPPLGRLWFHLGVYDLMQMTFRSLDKFMVSLLLTERIAAVYFNGAVEVPFLPVILGAVSSAAQMQMAHIGDAQHSHMVSLLNRSAVVLAYFVFPLFFFLFTFREELFNVVFTARYAASVPIFACSLLTVPLRSYSFTTVLQRLHRADIMNLGALCDILLALLLSYPCYILCGLPGVALSFTISTYAQATFYCYHTSKLTNMPMRHLIPIKQWAVLLFVAGVVFSTAHIAFASLLSPQFALLSGIGILALFTIIGMSRGLQSSGFA